MTTTETDNADAIEIFEDHDVTACALDVNIGSLVLEHDDDDDDDSWADDR